MKHLMCIDRKDRITTGTINKLSHRLQAIIRYFDIIFYFHFFFCSLHRLYSVLTHCCWHLWAVGVPLQTFLVGIT